MSNLPPRYITVHASATFPSMDIGVATIRKWHLDRGWNDVGYHYVIRRDGTVEKGREDHVMGAQVGSHNSHNIGICMAGGLKEGTQQAEDNFTDQQYSALTELITELHEEWLDAKLMGHNDFSGYHSRGCPCFNQHAYFEWLEYAWEADYKPDNWTDHSVHSWKNGIVSISGWKTPPNFYAATVKQ